MVLGTEIYNYTRNSHIYSPGKVKADNGAKKRVLEVAQPDQNSVLQLGSLGLRVPIWVEMGGT